MQKNTIIYGFWFFNELTELIRAKKRKLMTVMTPNSGEITFNTSSTRIVCLRHNPKCVWCGIVGDVWILVSQDGKPHLNLYHIPTKGEPILMTQDHIKPVSMGGTFGQYNLATMCAPCNGKKGSNVVSFLGARLFKKIPKNISS